MDWLQAITPDWLNVYDVAWRTVVAIIVIGLAYVIGKSLSHVAQTMGERLSRSAAIGNLWSMMIKVIVVVLAIVLVLRVYGLDGVAYSVLAGAGVAGIIIGFSLQEVAANFVSGMVLAIQRPFRVGHLIESNQVYGVVRAIHMRSTEVETLDGQLVHIPNKSVLLDVVTDYNYIPFRRVELTIGVTYGADLTQVKDVALAAVEQLDIVASDRPIDLYYTEFADSSINFDIRFWTPFRKEIDYLEARSQAVIAIQRAFADEAIEIPYPITTVFDGDHDAATDSNKKRSGGAA